jgi:hypothetical protein
MRRQHRQRGNARAGEPAIARAPRSPGTAWVPRRKAASRGRGAEPWGLPRRRASCAYARLPTPTPPDPAPRRPGSRPPARPPSPRHRGHRDAPPVRRYPRRPSPIPLPVQDRPRAGGRPRSGAGAGQPIDHDASVPGCAHGSACPRTAFGQASISPGGLLLPWRPRPTRLPTTSPHRRGTAGHPPADPRTGSHPPAAVPGSGAQRRVRESGPGVSIAHGAGPSTDASWPSHRTA